jgi:hypothetical protein
MSGDKSSDSISESGSVYQLKEAVFADEKKFTVTANAGQEKFQCKFLHMEWMIVMQYDQMRDQFKTETFVKMVNRDKVAVNASLTLQLKTSRKSADLTDDWAGAADDSLIVNWNNFWLKPDERKRCEPHAMRTKPLIGADVLMQITIRVFNLSLVQPNVTHDIWTQAVAGLFLSPDLSDITLVAANGTKFPAHRFVLKNRSQYFAGHLTHDPQSEIKVNAPADAVKEMIRFMYQDDVQQLDDVAHDLLQLADYYAITDLLDICADFLMLNLNPHNVTKVIEYSAAAGLSDLRSAALETFIRNMYKPEWKAQFASLPVVAQLIIRKMMDLTKEAADPKQKQDEKQAGLFLAQVTGLMPIRQRCPGRGREYHFDRVTA